MVGRTPQCKGGVIWTPQGSTRAKMRLDSLNRYSFDTGLLSPQQRLFYEENGFILVRNLVSDAKLPPLNHLPPSGDFLN
uniref:Uncharacterized protein n=1 Tax=Oryzias sinensis TaxID=183150 RepID=A0A8C7XH19_9TELE